MIVMGQAFCDLPLLQVLRYGQEPAPVTIDYKGKKIQVDPHYKSQAN